MYSLTANLQQGLALLGQQRFRRLGAADKLHVGIDHFQQLVGEGPVEESLHLVFRGHSVDALILAEHRSGGEGHVKNHKHRKPRGQDASQALGRLL